MQCHVILSNHTQNALPSMHFCVDSGTQQLLNDWKLADISYGFDVWWHSLSSEMRQRKNKNTDDRNYLNVI